MIPKNTYFGCYEQKEKWFLEVLTCSELWLYQSPRALQPFHSCWGKCSINGENAMWLEIFQENKSSVLSWSSLWALTCAFTSLCKIFLSWIYFSPREICTNQLRIYRGNIKQNQSVVWCSLKCLCENMQEEGNNIFMCMYLYEWNY